MNENLTKNTKPEKEPEQLFLDFEGFEEIEKTQVLEQSRRLGSILKKFRGVLPRKAFFLQALFATYFTTTEVAYTESESERFRLDYGRGLVASLYEYDREGKRIPLDKLREFFSAEEKEEAKMYMLMLGRLKAADFNISMEQKILIKVESGDVSLREMVSGKKSDEEETKKNKDILMQAGTLPEWPAILVESVMDDPSILYHHEPLVDEKLIPKTDVHVFPIRVRLKNVDPEHMALWAADYTNTKDPVFFFQIIKIGDQSRYEEACRMLQESLQKKVAEIDNEKLQQSIPEEVKRGKFITLDPENKISAERRNSVKKFFQHWDRVEIIIHRLVDYEYSGIVLSDKEKKVSSIVKEDGATIHAKGFMTIRLFTKLEKQPIPPDWNEDMLVVGKDHVEEEIDQYGNKIEARIFQQGEKGLKSTVITKDITITMPGIGISNGSPAFIDSKLLGPDGLPFLNRSIEEEFIVRKNGSAFLNPFNPETIEKYEDAKLDTIINGINEAEQLFGKQNDGFIKLIMILDMGYENAFFIPSEENSISFTEDFIKNQSTANIFITSKHETFHALAQKYGLDKTLEKLHLTLLAGDFLEKLDEKKFFKTIDDRAFGGHSRKESAEMIASFLVSITHPNWHEELKKHDAIFQEKYVRLMYGFANVVESITELRNTPIRNLMRERIAFIEKLRANIKD